MLQNQFNSVTTLAECSGTARKAFFGGIEAGNVALVKDILRLHPDAVSWRTIRDDISGEDTYGLHVAAQGGHEAIAVLLIGASADVNARDCEGSSPIMHAIRKGHGGFVKLLLKANANPNHRNGGDETPLMTAAHHGLRAAVELLLEHDANVHATRGKGNALFDAILSPNPDEEIIALLLRKGISPDHRNGDNKTVKEAAHGHSDARAIFLAVCLHEHEDFVKRRAKETLAAQVRAIHTGITRDLRTRKFTLKNAPK